MRKIALTVLTLVALVCFSPNEADAAHPSHHHHHHSSPHVRAFFGANFYSPGYAYPAYPAYPYYPAYAYPAPGYAYPYPAYPVPAPAPVYAPPSVSIGVGF